MKKNKLYCLKWLKKEIVHSEMNKLFRLSEIEKNTFAITDSVFFEKFPQKFPLGAIFVRKVLF